MLAIGSRWPEGASPSAHTVSRRSQASDVRSALSSNGTGSERPSSGANDSVVPAPLTTAAKSPEGFTATERKSGDIPSGAGRGVSSAPSTCTAPASDTAYTGSPDWVTEGSTL